MRISRHQAFMMTAEVWSQRSTCFRRAVGAVIVENRNIIAQGYNGPPSGEPHCTGISCPSDHVCTRAVHAEINAMRRAGLHTVPPRRHGLSMYVTESPCPTCAVAIYGRIDTVFFLNEYRIRDGIDMLLEAKIKVYRMTPSGYIINCKTGDLENEDEVR